MIDVPQHHESLLPAPGAVRIEDSTSPLMWVASARGRGLVSSGDILLLHARGDWSTARINQDVATLGQELLHPTVDSPFRLQIE
jgi:predicted NAD/FAD-dependent oxidoreductase